MQAVKRLVTPSHRVSSIPDPCRNVLGPGGRPPAAYAAAPHDGMLPPNLLLLHLGRSLGAHTYVCFVYQA